MSQSQQSQWYKTDQDGGIEYFCRRFTKTSDCGKYTTEESVTINRVIFDRFNEKAGVREQVSVHWTEAFKWADADPCGGLGLSAVELSDGRKVFASGMYFVSGDGGLAAVHVGAYGSAWMKRDKRVKRNQHGFAITE